MDICCTLSLGWISQKILFIHVSAFAYTRETQIFYFNGLYLQRYTNIAIKVKLRWWRQDCEGSRPEKNSVNNTVRIRLHLPGVILGRHNILCKTKLNMTIHLTRRFRIVCHLCGFFFSINLQILRTSNSFHQQFAKQTSSAAVTSDLFVVWYPGLCNKCLLIHGSFSDNPADSQKAHIQSKPTAVLKKLSSLIYTLLYKKISNK